MSDVLVRVFAPFKGALSERGIPAELLTEGLPFDVNDFQSAKKRISWDVFVLVCERAEKLLGSREELEAVTRKYSIHPRLEFMHRVLAVAATPRDLYWMGTMWFGRMLFNVVEDSFEEFPNGRIRETLSIPQPYRDSPQFFHMMKGVLEAAPTLLGAEHAHVEMDLQPRRAVYTIWLPPQQVHRGLLARILSRRAKPDVIKELIRQQEEFQQTHRALARISRIGRELAHNIELDKLGDTLLEHLTTAFGFTGVEFWVVPLHGEKPELLRAVGKHEEPRERQILLTSGGQELGRLDLWGPHGDPNEPPEDDHIEDLSELAPWISIALDNARTHSALRQASEMLQDRVRRQDAELLVANDSLQNAERLASVGTLAAGIAHEINNPVGSILLAAEYTQLRRGEPGAEPAIWETLDGIIHEAKRCAEIVKNVLRFSRNEPTKKKLYDLERTLRRAVAITKDYARGRGVALRANIGDGPCEIVMNSMEIEQVVVNLLRNAIEASGSCSCVTLSLSSLEDRAEITVSDEGCGIESEQARRIFDPFFTTRRSSGGTGLGLSVAHSIVAGHGGKLLVESEPGKGTRFTLVLPAAGPSDADEQ